MSEGTSSAPGQLAAGARVAGYRVGEQIGRGGMAVVYRAHDGRLDRWVALKVLAPDAARDESFRQRFIRESRAAAAVDHPHIIPVYEAGEADGVLFIAMRYVPDGDVRTLIDRVGPLPAARCCALIAQAASALDAAHARGLVHRDVKPTNMLLELPPSHSRPDHLYLSDFGLAKPSLSATGLTQTGQFFGTLDYVAPEQIQARPLDGRADQYALACTAFEMLSGGAPFRREHGMAVLSAHLSDPPPALATLRPGLPVAVDQVLARAMAKAPHDRYSCCLDFAEALLAARGQGGWGHVAPSGAAHPPTELAFPPTAPGAYSSPPPAPVPGTVPDLPVPPGDQVRGKRRRSRGPLVGALVAVLVIATLAVAGLTFVASRNNSAGGRPGTTASGHGASPAGSANSRPATPAAPPGPAQTVRAYFSAINHHDYGRAWNLGGSNIGLSYASFVNGFTTTVHDTVTILSVSGNVVTARISAQQSDGTIRVYQGTYTVQDGVITGFSVARVS